MKRPLLSLAFAAAIAALPATPPATAALTVKEICAGSLCFYKNPHRYNDGTMYYFLRFRGSEVTHYNLRFTERGGRTVQIEIGTVRGSNESGWNKFRNMQPGGRYTVHIQACKRGGLFQKSGCTGWHSITFFAPS